MHFVDSGVKNHAPSTHISLTCWSCTCIFGLPLYTYTHTHAHTTAHPFIKRDDWDPSETMTMVQQKAAFIWRLCFTMWFICALWLMALLILYTHTWLYISPFSGGFNGGWVSSSLNEATSCSAGSDSCPPSCLCVVMVMSWWVKQNIGWYSAAYIGNTNVFMSSLLLNFNKM